MAKMLFFQDVPFESFGVEFISSFLKSRGHEVDLVVLNQEEKGFDPIEFVKDTQPDVAAFSATTIDLGWSTEIAENIKADKELKDVVTVFGGAHPTMYPDMIDEMEGVDITCIGEGELAMGELMDNISRGSGDHSKIRNMHVRQNGRVYKNEIGKLVSDHDEMPWPDREIYYAKYPLLREMTTKKFFTGRGCPYKCTYCNNHFYQDLYKGKGYYINYRKPEEIIAEIKDVRDKYGMEYVYFAAETFTTNHKWLREFLPMYKEEIGIPWSCLSRPNELKEEIVKLMADTGCYYTSFGLESGSHRLREMLKRKMSEEQIVNAANLLHKYDVKFLVHQIMGLPTETLDEAFETIELDIKVKADSTWTTVFMPTIGTDLYDYVRDNNLIDMDNEGSFESIDSMYADSNLKQENAQELSNLQKLVWLCVTFPSLVPLVRKLIKLPPNMFFVFVSKWNMMLSFRMRYRLGYWEMLRMYLGSNKRFG